MRTDPWRLEFEHHTVFTYGAPARSSYNEVRMAPLTTPRQTTMSAHLSVSPSARQFRYWDYWGTQVVAVDVVEPHDRLEVRAAAVVETGPVTEPSTVTWDELGWAEDRLSEFLSPTPYTFVTPELTAVAHELRAVDPHQTVEAVGDWVHGALDYEPGTTGVHTSAVEAWQTGSGVCQDFAHLAVALLRCLGVPARYVSGYLHPNPDPDVGPAVAGQSHAWIEVWTGGWWESDPTNKVPVGPRHVTVGRGRDYSDVTPMKGIYAGGSEDSMRTEVLIKRTR